MHRRWTSALSGACVLLVALASSATAFQNLRPGTASVPLFYGSATHQGVQLNDGTIVRLLWALHSNGVVTLELASRASDGRFLRRTLPMIIGQDCTSCRISSLATDGRNLAVAWDADRPGDGLAAIFLRLYDSDLRPLTDTVQVSGSSAANRMSPSVAANAEQVLVAFEAAPPIDEPWQRTTLFARRFDWSGQAVGSPFRVDEPSPPGQLERGVEAIQTLLHADGDAVIFWHDRTGGEGTLGDAHTATFDIDNERVGPERILGIIGFEQGLPQWPAKVLELGGDSLFLWDSGTQWQYAQHFATGRPTRVREGSDLALGVDVQTYTTGGAITPEGHVVVTWTGRCWDSPEQCNSLAPFEPPQDGTDGDGSAAFARNLVGAGLSLGPSGPSLRLGDEAAGDQYARMVTATRRVRTGARWYTFSSGVSGDTVQQVRPLVAPCEEVAKATTSCTGRDERFRVEVWWRDFAGREGKGIVQQQSADWTSFSFFQPGQLDLLVKVLDAEAISDSHWVFLASLSDVDFEVYVTDTQSGLSRVYKNDSGTFASLGDVPGLKQIDPGEAYDPTGLLPPGPGEVREITRRDDMVAVPGSTLCTPSVTKLCFTDRFAAEVTWTDFDFDQGPGQRLELDGDSQAFWFFDPSNPELTVKMLDGRSINGHWWVYLGALTNVGFSLEITDLMTGERRSWTNQVSNFASFGDVEAFAEP